MGAIVSTTTQAMYTANLTMEKTGVEANATLRTARSTIESLKATFIVIGAGIGAGLQAPTKITPVEATLLIIAVMVIVAYIIKIIGWLPFVAVCVIMAIFVKKARESLDAVVIQTKGKKDILSKDQTCSENVDKIKDVPKTQQKGKNICSTFRGPSRARKGTFDPLSEKRAIQ